MAVQHGLIARNVAQDVKAPKRRTTTGEEHAFTEQEAQVLFRAIGRQRVKVVVDSLSSLFDVLPEPPLLQRLLPEDAEAAW